MAEGTVKWFNDRKGHGFIKSENKEFFVHRSSIQSPASKILKEGQKVQFEVTSGPRGEQAVNVKVIDEGTDQTTDEKIRAFMKASKEKLRDLKKRRDRR